jgi:hypothetical protein
MALSRESSFVLSNELLCVCVNFKRIASAELRASYS